MDSQLDSPDPGSSRQPGSSGVPKAFSGGERKRTEEKEETRKTKEDEKKVKGKKLHFEIAQMLNEEITDNYLQGMKLLSSTYLGPAILCKCKSPSDIFDKLEMKGHIGIGNYKILKDVLEQAGLVKVLKMVEEMEKDILPDTKPATQCLLQTELKTWYLNNIKRIRPLPMCKWDEQDLEHVFTNLQVVQGKKHRFTDSFKEQISRPTREPCIFNTIVQVIPSKRNACFTECPTHSFKEQSSRPTNDPEILDRIFKVTPPERNICLIEGPAGIGKSTLCRQFAYLWSKDDYKIHGHHFDLVGILEARSLKENFRKSFVQELFPEDFEISEDEICQHFKTVKSLLIIDGVDELTADGELAITQLLKGKFFRNVHLIITGRPESVTKFLPYAILHLEVKGFSVRNAEEYICKYFRNDENNYKKRLLDRLRDDGELSELVVNPFVTVLLCFLVREKAGDIPSNVSQIYHEIMRTICGKYVKNLQEKGECSPKEDMLYNAACYVAYAGVTCNVFVFPENVLNSLCGGDLGVHLLKSGILSKGYTLSRFDSNEFCYFPHRSFQEFFCGCYFEKLDLDTFKKEVLRLFPYYPASVTECLRYLRSTQVDKTKIVLEHLFERQEQSTDFRIDVWTKRSLCYLGKANPGLDVVDFFRKHFNISFTVARFLLQAVGFKFSNGPLDDQVPIAICKMDLPLVTGFTDAPVPDRGDISPTTLTVTSVLFKTNSRLLKYFTKSNGPKMPFIHCCSIRDASACLQKLRRFGVLAIAVTPNALNDVVDLQAFQQDLTSVENKINIVFVFLDDRYDDSRFPHFISLVKGYSSDKVKIQLMTVKELDGLFLKRHSWSIHLTQALKVYDRACGIGMRRHELPQPLHWECYDRFCPY